MDSSAVVNKMWKKEHFKEATRVQQAMLSHVDDVLSAEAMLKVRPSPGIPGKPSRTVCMNESATFVLSVVGHSQGGQQCERRGQDVSRFLRRKLRQVS